jgi:quercetin 2,3-dioxygenase
MTTHLEESIIYLAENRIKNTINSSQIKTTHVQITERTLPAGDGYNSSIDSKKAAIIVPYIGDVVVFSEKKKFLIQESDAIFGLLNHLEIQNPYLEHEIRFYEIILDKTILKNQEGVVGIQRFKNELLRICPQVWIGQYGGRSEDIFKLESPKNQVFAYVIDGTFEVQGRLLQANDTLKLWNAVSIDFEALSNDAIILIIEHPED